MHSAIPCGIPSESAPWQRTLALVCDTLLPADPSAWRASVAQRGLARLNAQRGLGRARSELKLYVRLLESPLANLLLGGTYQRFSAMDRTQRERHLRVLARHQLPMVRGGFHALKRLAGVFYYGDADADGQNPTWARLGYPGPLAASPPTGRPLVPLCVDADRVIDCDVVVVGSGVGGGIVAADLAAAGQHVVVLESGPYLTESDFTQREVEMLSRAYMDGGLGSTSDQGVALLAGACLGGGSVVNYTTSLRTPDSVRAEWTRSSRLDLFSSRDFDRALDRATARLGVNRDHNRPSTRDALMLRGLTALGWHVERMPRNVAGCTQDDVCGYCGLGCVRGAKRSSVKACLEPASTGHGVQVIVNCTAQRVRIEHGRAVGVEATMLDSGARLVVRARATVAAGGSIGSPALLLRSGVEGPVGQHLHLHPVTAVWGRFDEEVRPWTGTMQALYSEQFADLDAHYGVRLETAGVHPSLLALAAAWHDPASYDRLVTGLASTTVIGVLTRDRSSGQVLVTRQGMPLVRYRVSRYDQGHIRRGMIGSAEVLAAAGAREVFTSQAELVTWRPTHEPLEDLVLRADRVGYATNRMLYVSFHQMGSCRMGANPRHSVTNADGEVHTLRNLFVADASLFPGASGVNPMLTIAALADHVAQRIQARIGH